MGRKYARRTTWSQVFLFITNTTQGGAQEHSLADEYKIHHTLYTIQTESYCEICLGHTSLTRQKMFGSGI